MSFLVPRLRARASAGSAMALRGVRLQSSWKPAVKPGTVPVYDEALAYLEADAQVVRERIEEESQKADSSEESQRRLYGLRVVSEINLPHVRSQYKQGNCVYGMLTTDDLREPVFRHLREQAWRQSGVLNRLVRDGSNTAGRASAMYACLARCGAQRDADRGPRSALWYGPRFW